jgi:DNA polymerase elongation subunit (family B)
MPKEREYERGGKTAITYDLIGRLSMDYMQLYKKYNYEERHSYALNSIAEVELGETKIAYDGTLDELYNDDYKKFLEYNLQDTRLLDKLDKKLQFIDLANNLAHTGCVTIQATMGTVAVTDQNVLMEAHSRNMICPDKKHGQDEKAARAAGGWVANPKKGFHRWIGSTDMKSLYPSVIRTLNMSPETIVGQIRLDRTNEAINEWEAKGGPKHTFAAWWNDRFNVLEMEDFYNKDIGNKLFLDLEDGSSYELSGKELYELVFNSNQPWCISANGTIFRTDTDGVIPSLLTRWYNERKVLQGIMTNYQNIEDNPKIEGVKIPADLFCNDTDISDIEIKANSYLEGEAYRPKKLKELIDEGYKKRVMQYMNQHNLMIKDGKAIHRNQKELKQIIGYWDKRQLVRKLSLNGSYGALLNAGSRFFDQRLGQSTTLTGRSVTKHMCSKTNEMITGEYDHYGQSVVYGDTDSEISTTRHLTNFGEKTIEELFNGCVEFWKDGDKEYAYDPNLLVMSYDEDINEPYMGHTEYIYRHKVSKDLFEIEDELGNIITVTEDHSVMIERNGNLIDVKPMDILESDILISVKVNNKLCT